MITLSLIGIGTGNPDHVTFQGLKAMNEADVILIPRKGAEKSELADLRREICEEMLVNSAIEVIEFDLPVRDTSQADKLDGYLEGVSDWHDAVALAWTHALSQSRKPVKRAALLIWGDPSLYDSSLRIAERLSPPVNIQVIPGVSALHVLCASHRLTLNQLGEPFLVTTGRKLRTEGWPDGINTLVVMLDGTCAFQTLNPDQKMIWWGAYLGMENEILLKGPLATAGPEIIETRAKARQQYGWIMDTYLIRALD